MKVSKRSDILIEDSMQILDADLEKLRKEFDEISRMVEENYYNSNSMVDMVMGRNFFEVLKAFIDSSSPSKRLKQNK